MGKGTRLSSSKKEKAVSRFLEPGVGFEPVSWVGINKHAKAAALKAAREAGKREAEGGQDG